jgi:plasmid maintenance system antidote protein VapI
MDALVGNIYNELKYLKKVKNQTDFAQQLGLGKSYVSTLIASSKPPIREICEKLQSKFGISAVWLATNGNSGTDMFGNVKRVDVQNIVAEEPSTYTAAQKTHKNEGDIDMDMLYSLIQTQHDYAIAAKDNAAAAKDTARANLILTELLQSTYGEHGMKKKVS